MFDRFIETPEPDVTPDGDSLEGAVRNLKASFSVLKGTVINAPESSPSLMIAILAPGYCFCRLAFAAATSEALKPETDTPLEPCISSLGNRSFRPTVTEPSALNVVLVS